MLNLLIERKDYPGFFVIPGYSNYAIDVNGRVINTSTHTWLSGSKNPAGYVNFRLTNDHRVCLTIGRHRLMCYVFKNPNVDITSLYVNHINGIKGDDRLDNLEWVTPTENCEHAGMYGLTSKCIPVVSLDVNTGIMTKYNSITKCAADLGLSKDAVIYRLNHECSRIFPEGRQYRFLFSKKDWMVCDDIQKSLLENGLKKAVLIKNHKTNTIIEFETLTEAAKYLNISKSALSIRLSTNLQYVYSDFNQYKWKNDETDWRQIKDLYLEIEKSSGSRCVVITDLKTGNKQIFLSIKDCAQFLKLNKTTLIYRLQNNHNKIHDGKVVGYYSKSIISPYIE